MRASSTCELVLENVEVPEANVLGEVGQGYKLAIETLNEGRIGIGAQMLGLATGALEGAVAYAGQREAFGQPIGHFQAMQHLLAECTTDVATMRLHVYNAARKREAGLSIMRDGAMAKLVCSRLAESVASRCVGRVRRHRCHRGVSGREVPARREGRPDLRGHDLHAAQYDRPGRTAGRRLAGARSPQASACLALPRRLAAATRGGGERPCKPLIPGVRASARLLRYRASDSVGAPRWGRVELGHSAFARLATTKGGAA